MRKLVLAGAIALASMRLAAAADVAPPPIVKATLAPPAPACTINSCTGFYVGAGLSGITNNLNVFGNGIGGSLNAGGTLLDVHGGYRLWNGKFYLGAELVASYDVSGGTSGLGVSFSDRFSGMELVKIGGSLSAFTGGGTFPPALQPYLMSLYGIVGGKQRMGATGVVGGAGAEFVIGPTSTISLEYLNVQYGGGGTSDTAGLAVTDENLARLSYHYNFPVGGI